MPKRTNETTHIRMRNNMKNMTHKLGKMIENEWLAMLKLKSAYLQN